MNRVVSRSVLALVLAAALATTGCAKKVTVTDGTIVMCSAGHVISDDTKELEVKASEVSKYGVTTRTETCAKHKSLAKMLSDAEKSAADGDVKAAKATLEKILADDPANSDAQRLIAKIEGKKPSGTSGSTSNTTGGSNTSAGDTEKPSGPILSLARFVPDKLDGFVAQGLTADLFVITRSYLPASGPLGSLVIVAEQYKDAPSAKAALDGDIKSSYPDARATVKLGGISAYYGQRQDFAVVAFTSDSVLVVAEGSAKSGKAADIKAALTNAASQIAR